MKSFSIRITVLILFFIFSTNIFAGKIFNAAGEYQVGGDQYGSISGSVFIDLDGDCLLDTNESIIPFVGIMLIGPDGYKYDTQTDANGNYIFQLLTEGAYSIVLGELPAGYIYDNGVIPVTLGLDEDDIVSFCVSEAAALYEVSGIVYNDANCNGAFDTGEDGIVNTIVYLNDEFGNTIQVVNTLADSSYTFTNVPDGSYNVVVGNGPINYTSCDSGEYSITVSGSNINDLTSCFCPPIENGGISGNAFVDLDGDCFFDENEVGLLGVEIILLNANGTKTFVSTDTNGHYDFSDLEPGTYTVQIGNFISGFDFSGTAVVPVNLESGDYVAGVNFCYENANTATGGISGHVFVDEDGDCVLDAGESGIGSIEITLVGPDGYKIVVVTDEFGNYAFTDLGPGLYTVLVGNAGSGYELIGIGVVPVDLAAGEFDIIHFCYVENASQHNISGTVYEDGNCNGSFNNGEIGLEGIPVYLYDEFGNILSVTNTDADGAFSFLNVVAGNYTVGIGNGPDGYTACINDDHVIDLQSDVTNLEFCFCPPVQPGTISGTVFVDLNGDCIHDADEIGFGGIEITLISPDGSKIFTTTDEFGNYTFADLEPGVYTVSIGQIPGGYILVNDAFTTVILNEGDQHTNVNFCLTSEDQFGNITGCIFSDTNCDGINDAGEPGIIGEVIYLSDEFGNILQTVSTDDNGNFLFENIIYGDYTVAVAGDIDGYVSCSNQSYDVVLDDGFTTKLAYCFCPQTSTGDTGVISGIVFADLDGGCTHGAGDENLAGIQVTLFSTDGTKIITETNANGEYTFVNLPPGSYTVVVGAGPDGYVLNGDSSLDVLLEDGEISGGHHFCFTPSDILGTIGDYVWYDDNGDGIQDANEAPIEGVVVYLYDEIGNIINVATTDANGYYLFTDLPSGNYTVVVGDGPNGYTITTVGSYDVALGAGENYVDADFGFTPPIINNCDDPQICGELSACTAPLTAVTICPADCFTGDYTIFNMYTLYECNLEELANGCIEYTPKAGMDTIGYDYVYVTIKDNNDVCHLVTFLIVIGECGDVCLANAGGLIVVESSVCYGGVLVANVTGPSIVPTGFDVLYVLVDGNSILAASATPYFPSIPVGNYSMHTLVYNSSDFDILSVNTVSDLVDLIDFDNGGYCGSLETTGAAFEVKVCEPVDNCDDPNFCGEITVCTAPSEPVTLCPSDCYGNDFTIHDMYTLYQCDLSEDGNGCLVYTPKDGMGAIGYDYAYVTIKDNNDVCHLVTFLIVIGECGDVCLANAGGLIVVESSVCYGGVLVANVTGPSTVPTGFDVLYVLVDGNSILAASATPYFPSIPVGNYSMHTLVYNSSDFDILSVNTVSDLVDLIDFDNGGYCGSLETTGAAFEVKVCEPVDNCDDPNFCGEITVCTAPSEPVTLCPSDCYGNDFTIHDMYTLYQCDLAEDGNGCLVYTPKNGMGAIGYDYAYVTIKDNNDVCHLVTFLITIGECGEVCLANAGSLDAVEDEVCEGGVLYANVTSPSTVPAGYEVLFVLVNGNSIIASSATPYFPSIPLGSYSMHTLVYNSSDIDILSINTVSDLVDLIDFDNGNACGSLELTGAPFTVKECEPVDPECLVTAGGIGCDVHTVCVGYPFSVYTTDPPTAPQGYTVGYILISRPSLSIVEISDSPEFTQAEAGLFAIHTFVYETGTLSDFDSAGNLLQMIGLLQQGGGDICGAILQIGANFTVQDCTEPCTGEDIVDCINPMTPLMICPDFCSFSPNDSYEITEHTTENECSISIVGDCIRYTPLPNFTGTETIQITACNGAGVCETITAYITVGNCGVTPPNNPPVANDDNTTTQSGTPVTINVLGNDSDPDGDNVYICNTAGDAIASNGTVVLSGTGFIYTPNAGFYGQDSFTYTICDGNGGTDTATVFITVPQPNTPCDWDQTLCVLPYLTSQEPTTICIDFCGQNLTITDHISNYSCGIEYISDACFNYTPLPLFEGDNGMTIIACDGQGTCHDIAINITVGNCGGVTPNNPPVAYDDNTTTQSGTPVTINVLGNDSDPDGDNVYICNTAEDAIASNGTVVLSGTGFIYTPNADFYGQDSFTYTICDGNGGTDTATVFITVPQPNTPCDWDQTLCVLPYLTSQEPTTICIDFCGQNLTITDHVSNYSCGIEYISDACFNFTPLPLYEGANDLTIIACDGQGTCHDIAINITVGNCGGVTPNNPPVAYDDNTTTQSGTPVTINVLGNDSDPDGDNVYICNTAVDAIASNGTVVLSGTGFIYTPNAGFYGQDSFTYTICDGNGGTDTATVFITVPQPNTPCDWDQTLCVLPYLTSQEPTTICIDFCGQNLTITDHVSNYSCGIEYISDACFNFTPLPLYEGANDLTIIACDGQGTCHDIAINITVGNCGGVTPNNPPVAYDDNTTTQSGTPVTINVLGNDSDPDGDNVYICNTAVDAIASNGTVVLSGTGFIYTPNAGFYGQDSFTYTICDGNGGTDTATVFITVPTDNCSADQSICVPPFNTNQTPNLICIDFCGTGMVINDITSAYSCGILQQGNTCFNYTPLPGQEGENIVTVSACNNNGQCETAIVNINVTNNCDGTGGNTNTEPTAVPDYATASPNTPTFISVLGNDSDPDGDNIYICNHAGDAIALNGIVVLSGTGFNYTPNAGFTGSDSFTYTICDGNGGTSTTTVYITVPNDNCSADQSICIQPFNTNQTAHSICIDFCGTGMVINDITSAYSCGITQQGNNCFTYTPLPGQEGANTITITACNNAGQCETAIVSVNVTNNCDGTGGNTNSNPIANDDYQTVNINTAAFVTVTANDSDPDGDIVSVCANNTSTASNGTVSFANGVFTYTPNNGFTGTDSFTYTVCDGNGGTATATVYITVTGGQTDNTNPIAVDDYIEVPYYSAININVIGNDGDFDGNPLTVCGFTNPANGTITQNGNVLEYIPNINFSGQDSFTYTICDGNGGSSTATVYLTVAAEGNGDTGGDTGNPVCGDDEIIIACGGYTAVDVLQNDYHPNGSYIYICGIEAPIHGYMQQFGTEIQYWAADGFSGSDLITYTVCDAAGNSADGHILITVNCDAQQTIIANDDSAITPDNHVLFISPLSNDIYPAGCQPVINVLTPDYLCIGELLVTTDGQLVYIPQLGFSGVEVVEYQICCDNVCDNGTINIEVIPHANCSVDGFRIPTSFSPNHDGINDYINLTETETFIEPDTDTEVNFTVFTSYGEIVYESSDYRNTTGWDGKTNSGTDLPEGAYFFRLEVKSPNGSTSKDGAIELRR